MKFKNIVFISLFLITVLTIGAVSAVEDIDFDDALAIDDVVDESLEVSSDDDIITMSDEDTLSREIEDSEDVLAGSNMDTHIGLIADEKRITTNPDSDKFDDHFIWVSVPKSESGKVIVTIGKTTVFSKTLKQFASKNIQNDVIDGLKAKKYAISFTDLKDYKNFFSKFKTGDVMTISFFKDGEEIEWIQYSLTANENGRYIKFKRMPDTMIECVDWHKKGSSNKAYFGLKNPKNDKPLAGYKLTITLDGKKYVRTTDKNGRVCLSFSDNSLFAKTYMITARFAGDSKYVKSVETIKYTVTKTTKKASATKKTNTKLSAGKKTFNVTVKNKMYSVTLKNRLNKAISKAKLTIKVNGKTFKATTNSKGKATFKITNLSKKATFNATVTFKGSSKYKKVSKSVKIICR